MKFQSAFGALFVMALLSGTADAGPVAGLGTWESALQARDLDGNAANGAEAYYDAAFNLTYLRAGSTQEMDWATADAWARQDRYGFSGWRLPTALDQQGTPPSYGAHTGSEMGHLYFELLGNSYATPLANTGDFQNMVMSYYWTSTDTQFANHMWSFGIYGGYSSAIRKEAGLLVWAVRDGDLLTNSVPEPGALGLTLTALAGLACCLRRRPRGNAGQPG